MAGDDDMSGIGEFKLVVQAQEGDEVFSSFSQREVRRRSRPGTGSSACRYDDHERR